MKHYPGDDFTREIEWEKFLKDRQCLAAEATCEQKLFCIELESYKTNQARHPEDILNQGGSSITVFRMVSRYLTGDEDRFIQEVESMSI